jgi:hypothetical protein
MAFAAGRSFVILQSMAQNNPEAKKLLDDLNNISQEDFEKRFGELLGNNKSADKEDKQVQVGDETLTAEYIDDGKPIDKMDDVLQQFITNNSLEGIKPIDEETSFGQPNIKTNETKSAIDGIKGMDYEPTKYVFKNVLPYRNKILKLQNKFEEMMLEEGFGSFDQADDFEDIYDDDEVYEMYDGIINNDVSAVKSSIDKFVEKYQDTAGDGDSQGRRNVFLEEYFRPAYKPPKVVSSQEFEKLSKGKTVLFRGVGTQSTVKNTLFGDKAWYMYGGAKGDGIYMSSLQNVAADYSLGQNTIMEFIVPDDLKTINEKVLQRVGRRFSERINEKIRSLAMDKIDENTAKELESLENLDNVMRNCGYTALAIIMGFDAVDVPFVGSLSEEEIKSKRKTQGVTYGKNFKLYKNYVFLNLDKLIAKDITKGEK